MFSMQDEKPKFVADPRGVPTCLPTSVSYAPFQLSTQTGTVIIDLTTTDGLFIFLPSWAEKVMGWYYPMNPSTQTFGTPIRLDYNIDIDQFYELYRVISGLFTIVGNTTSTTMAAFSGNFSGAEAYNSLANLIGNGSTVYQVYSYANILGLTSDPLRKEGAIPAYEGIGAFFINNPRRQWGRLEDTVPTAPSSIVNTPYTYQKYVDINDSYALHGRSSLNIPTQNLTSGVDNIYGTGKILMDFVRASSINWSVSGVLTPSVSNSYFQVRIYYEMYDIADTVVATGRLSDERYGPTLAGTPISFTRSGSYPTAFNVSETAIEPPIRSIQFFFEFVFGSTNVVLTFAGPVNFTYEVPIYNGLKDGIIQSPILISHSGNEIGTKLSVSARLNIEAKMNSEVNKFTQVRYRDVSNKYERALMKIASNPGKYGLRYIFRLSKMDAILAAWDAAIQMAAMKHSEQKLDMLVQLYSHCCDGMDKTQPPEVRAEAATRASKVFKKLGKKIKGVSKEVAEKVLKPALQEALVLGKTTLASGLQTLIPEVYNPPRVNYSGRVVSSAATGFLQAALKMPKSSIKTESDDSSTSTSEFCITRDKATLFPVLYVDEEGELVSSNKTVVGLMAIVPSRLLTNPKPNTIRTQIKNYCIENYASTAECPQITPIDPRENVTLMAVDSILPEGYCLKQPPFPVTGRSLDLALWAYNNKLGHGMVFTSQVDAGQICSMDTEVSLLKRQFAANNKLTIVGNFEPMLITDRCISVKTLPDLVRLLSARGISRQPNALRRGWLYAMSVLYKVRDVQAPLMCPEKITKIGYDGDRLYFEGDFPENSVWPSKYERYENGWFLKLDMNKRYKLEKYFASFFTEESESVDLSNDVVGQAVLAKAATTARAAIVLHNFKDFSSIIEAGKTMAARDLWALLNLRSLNVVNGTEYGAALSPMKVQFAEQDSAEKAGPALSGLVVQPRSNLRVKGRFVASKPVPIKVGGEAVVMSLPVDLGIYRQFISDPELLSSIHDPTDRAQIYLTFKYLPIRASNRNLANLQEILKKVDDFSADFQKVYGDLTVQQANNARLFLQRYESRFAFPQEGQNPQLPKNPVQVQGDNPAPGKKRKPRARNRRPPTRAGISQ